jgi:4-coumarate--CoA ligase
MICDADVYGTLKEAMKEMKNNATFYTSKGKVPGVKEIQELLEPTGVENNYEVTKFKDPWNKVLALLPSSGTTDHLKGICISQSMYFNLIPLVKDDEISLISFSAIFWGPAFASLVICPITTEVRIVTRRPFEPELYMKAVMETKASHLIMNPIMLTMIFNSPMFKEFDTSHVKMLTAIGGIITENLRVKMKKAFPRTYIMIFFGLTEISCALSYPGQPIDDLTVGYVAPNHMMKVVDDDGNALNLGERGEILIKSCDETFLVNFLQIFSKLKLK